MAGRRASGDRGHALGLADHLPGEAAEALLELATGGKPRVPQPAPAGADPFEHPDAQRRFRVMTNVEELRARARLSRGRSGRSSSIPSSGNWVERDYSGPARVSGSAGTGKTIVALHRAVYLARANPDARVLLTTFSDTLANALRHEAAAAGQQRAAPGRADRRALARTRSACGSTRRTSGRPKIASARDDRASCCSEAASAVGGHKFSLQFLLTEWEQVVDAWQLETWEAYRDVARLGRKTRLPEAQRAVLWSIFERVRAGLQTRRLITDAEMFTPLAAPSAKSTNAAVRLRRRGRGAGYQRRAAAVPRRAWRRTGRTRCSSPATSGQRIFQQPFSWKALGVDIRGRSRTLRVNYRTSHQIRTQADRLLGPEVTDVDGNTEDRSDTVSVFNGPPPEIQVLDTQAGERSGSRRVAPREGQGRRAAARDRRLRPLRGRTGPRAGRDRSCRLPFKMLDEHVETRAAAPRSAPCTSPRAWNSAPSR